MNTNTNLVTILQYAAVITVIVGAIVLCALGQLSATVTAGLLGVVLGGHGVALVSGGGK